MRTHAALTLARFFAGGRPGRPHELHLRDGSREEALLYEPSSPARATVLAVHGLNLRAQHDPRLVAVASALCRSGYRVICPRVRGLDRLEVAVDISARLVELIEATRRQHSPRVGLFSASFAAGQCLQAAAEPSLAPHVSGMLLVGAYIDAGALLHHVLTVPDGDDYGRLIVIRGMLREELSQGLMRAVDASLSDQALRPELPQLPQALAALSVAERERFWALARDPVLGRELASRIEQTRPELVRGLTVLSALDSLRASVTLVHGRKDPVIPASESERLAALLRERGLSSHLHVSDLLDHGDLVSGLRGVLELPALVRAVAFWLRALESCDRT